MWFFVLFLFADIKRIKTAHNLPQQAAQVWGQIFIQKQQQQLKQLNGQLYPSSHRKYSNSPLSLRLADWAWRLECIVGASFFHYCCRQIKRRDVYGIPHKDHEEIVQHWHALHNNWLNFIESLATWELCHKLEAPGKFERSSQAAKSLHASSFSITQHPRAVCTREVHFGIWRKT